MGPLCTMHVFAILGFKDLDGYVKVRFGVLGLGWLKDQKIKK